jgi:translin
MMLDKKTFERIRKEFEVFDQRRETLIKTSRDVLKHAKAAIYATHRKEFKEAENELNESKKAIKIIEELIKKDPHLGSQASYRDALEEYVEASCYYSYIQKRNIPTDKQLGVDTDVYLPGLCDLVGELVRSAINASIREDYKHALEIREIVTELYAELILFNFPNTPVRRKFDSIKYSLEKLEDIIFNLKIRQKI